MSKPETIKIDEVEYVRKDSITKEATSLNGMKYCIVRTCSAGVFAGYVAKKEGMEVEMRKARRLYSWAGAATLSQLAMEGVKNPKECKFPQEVETITLTQVIEIIPCTEIVKNSIAEVAVWKV